MIKWYKPSEKMPEVWDEIVVFGMDKSIIIYEENFIARMIYSRDKKLENWSHWAYAKDFNFPKENE